MQTDLHQANLILKLDDIDINYHKIYNVPEKLYILFDNNHKSLLVN